MQYVTYQRVSTQEQKKSGLGLLAQQRDIDIYLTTYSDVPYEVIGEFADTGSGADNGRPELQKALALAKKTGATLLVAKLDRLSRRVSQIAQIMEDPKITFRVATMPHADKFQLHIYGALAEQEREFISLRTKAALAQAKARGVKLGGYRGNALTKANTARTATATAIAVKLASMVGPMRRDGMTLEQIADRLQEQGVQTPQNGTWTAKAVSRVLARVMA
jgi:DNA invertase Pin-like site-specific DNA recombinase